MKKTRLQELFFKRQTEKDNTIQPSKRRSLNIDNCLFCEKNDGNDKLRHFLTLEAGENVRTMVCELKDTELMVKTTGKKIELQW